jgi:tRNA(Glu) U13 pseudouridine synthase TruD
MQALNMMMHALNRAGLSDISSADFTFAGTKDKRAITVQTMAVAIRNTVNASNSRGGLIDRVKKAVAALGTFDRNRGHSDSSATTSSEYFIH